MIELDISSKSFRPGNRIFCDSENRENRLVARLSRECRVSCAAEKAFLMAELHKVDKCLREHALTQAALTAEPVPLQASCSHSRRGTLRCRVTVSILCATHHIQMDTVWYPRSCYMNWDEMVRTSTGIVNGSNVTKAMLYNCLRALGQWEPRFRQLRKEFLLEKLNVLQCRENAASGNP